MKITFGLLFLSIICSCVSKRQSPPEAIVVEAPTSVASEFMHGKYFLLLLLKNDSTISYKYDTTANDNGLKKIVPFTSANIKTTLDEVEKIYNVKLDSGDNLLVKSTGEPNPEGFKKIKEALKEKQIFKFRIVTTNDN
jgi:hypothetical protein